MRHIVDLAERHAGLAEDGLGGQLMEGSLRQGPVADVGRAGHVEHHAGGQFMRDRPVGGGGELVRADGSKEIERFGNAGAGRGPAARLLSTVATFLPDLEHGVRRRLTP